MSLPERMYTTKETAEFLGCGQRDIQRYIRDGKIPAIKIGKSYKIKESTIISIQNESIKL